MARELIAKKYNFNLLGNWQIINRLDDLVLLNNGLILSLEDDVHIDYLPYEISFEQVESPITISPDTLYYKVPDGRIVRNWIHRGKRLYSTSSQLHAEELKEYLEEAEKEGGERGRGEGEVKWQYIADLDLCIVGRKSLPGVYDMEALPSGALPESKKFFPIASDPNEWLGFGEPIPEFADGELILSISGETRTTTGTKEIKILKPYSKSWRESIVLPIVDSDRNLFGMDYVFDFYGRFIELTTARTLPMDEYEAIYPIISKKSKLANTFYVYIRCINSNDEGNYFKKFFGGDPEEDIPTNPPQGDIALLIEDTWTHIQTESNLSKLLTTIKQIIFDTLEDPHQKLIDLFITQEGLSISGLEMNNLRKGIKEDPFS